MTPPRRLERTGSWKLVAGKGGWRDLLIPPTLWEFVIFINRREEVVDQMAGVATNSRSLRSAAEAAAPVGMPDRGSSSPSTPRRGPGWGTQSFGLVEVCRKKDARHPTC